MLTHFDHVTVVVGDIDAAKKFLGLLGFREDRSAVISGEPFAAYMSIPDDIWRKL